MGQWHAHIDTHFDPETGILWVRLKEWVDDADLKRVIVLAKHEAGDALKSVRIAPPTCVCVAGGR
jgi:hypothetical protein